VRQREDIFLYEIDSGMVRTEVYSDIVPDYNAGVLIPMPEGDLVYFLAAGDNPCGTGPKH
jgi:hypothetical protein